VQGSLQGGDIVFHFLRRVGGLEKSEFGKLGVATAFSEAVRGGGEVRGGCDR
jgi:hypothetical protein